MNDVKRDEKGVWSRYHDIKVNILCLCLCNVRVLGMRRLSQLQQVPNAYHLSSDYMDMCEFG